MSEIEKILEQNMEEYESARRRAKKLVKGYTREISRTYEYADALVNLPVNPNQIFFLWEKGNGDGELIREMFETYNVPEEDQMVPFVFLTDSYLAGEEAIRDNLETKLSNGDGLNLKIK